MSHRAMNWALEQRNLKPGAWVVLIKLADRHNKDTLRVDPEQALLAFDCNMSKSTINVHLGTLESMGLLVRVPRLNPQTKKQLSTFYILEPDFKKPPHIDFAVSDFRTRVAEAQNGNIGASRVRIPDAVAESGKTPIPSPENSQSRVRNPDTNLVREPVREPCASEAEPQTFDLDNGFLDDFIAVYPRSGSRDAVESALIEALTCGADPDVLISSAKAYAKEQKGNETRYIAYPDNWLSQRRWQQHEVKPVDPNLGPAVNQAWITAFANANGNVARHCPASVVRELVAAGLVTPDQCRAVEVRL